jgi:uncharacterized membrane protein YbhN (UPF0104 family)
LVLGWPALTSALAQLRAPHGGRIAAALVAALASMSVYARMQRSLLSSAGVRVSLRRLLALTFAAHSLNETLPGGPAFSARLNYQQLRRFGATPAVASWCIALSGVLSTAALAVVSAGGAVAGRGTPPWLSLLGLAGTILVTTGGVRLISRRPESLMPLTRVVLARFNRVRRRPADDGLERVRALLGQLRGARLTPGHAVAAAAYALLNWLLDAVCLWLCLDSVAASAVRPTVLLLAFCAGMAAGSLTIVPGGLGVIDNAVIVGLTTGGLDAPTAIAAVVLYRLITLGLVIGAGWITWLVIRRDQARAAVYRSNAVDQHW